MLETYLPISLRTLLCIFYQYYVNVIESQGCITKSGIFFYLGVNIFEARNIFFYSQFYILNSRLFLYLLVFSFSLFKLLKFMILIRNDRISFSIGTENEIKYCKSLKFKKILKLSGFIYCHKVLITS